MNIFQEHVLPNAKEDLSQSELFTNENVIDAKDKEFINTLSNKSSKDLLPKEMERLKHIVRKNIPVSMRMKIWLLLSGGAEITYKSLYTETCEELFTKDGFIPDGGDSPDKQFLTYYLTPDGGRKLRRVLCVIKHLNPDITFCPLLEPVTSILLHFFEEEATFAVVSGLLSGDFSAPFLDQTKIENVTTDATLQDLFHKVNKKGYTRLSNFYQPEARSKNKVVLFPSWRMCIFENLDFVSLTRLMDCLLAEGVKMLYRFGLYLLEAFYEYSLTFQRLQCSTADDLVMTIGQFAESLKISAEDLVNNATKISITTKQVTKFRQDNLHLYKANKLDWVESTIVKQVVAIDLRQVSDIIRPSQWQELAEWLPMRIQIKQPFLLFTTNRDGYNLKTLYQLCEEEEETLIIIQTTTDERFGAYLSVPLIHRHDGKKNMSYFGTGETFLFTLSPKSRAYHWGNSSKFEDSNNRKKTLSSRYVFVDTKPLINNEAVDGAAPVHSGNKQGNKKGSKKTSMRRKLSKRLNLASSSKDNCNQQTSISDYTKSDRPSISPQPLNSINIKRSSYSVPKHLYLGNAAIKALIPPTIPESKSFHTSLEDISTESTDRKKLISAQTIDIENIRKLQKTQNVIINDENLSEAVDGPSFCIKERANTEILPKNKVKMTISGEDGDRFDIIDEATAPPKIGSPSRSNTVDSSDDVDANSVHLFISCDDNRMVIGGGGGEGLWMDGELAKGRSTKCQTFKNDPLTSGNDGDFIITRIDVFAFK